MSLSERTFEEAKRLPEAVEQQLLDDMDAVIAENLPALKELAK